MAYILLPVVHYNKHTDKEEGVRAQLVNLDPLYIRSIEENIEGYAKINYFNSPSIETKVLLVNILQLLTRGGQVNYSFISDIIPYSNNIRQFIKDFEKDFEDAKKSGYVPPPYYNLDSSSPLYNP